MNCGDASPKLTKSVMDFIAKSVPAPDRKPFIEANLLKLFQNVVMPSIAVTEEEIEEFESEPDIYLRNDLEEADLQTRRRNSLKFIERLSCSFRSQITSMVNDFAAQLLEMYNADRCANWKHKMSLLNLLYAITIGLQGPRFGVIELAVEESQLHAYLDQLVIPELQEPDID